MKKHLGKILSVMMAFCIVMAAFVLPGSVLTASAFSGGDGSSGSPYLISSAADLISWQTAASGGERYEGKYLALTNDIDISGQAFNGIANFYGTFDGRGHVISGINITATNDQWGFFKLLGASGKTITIKNLTLTGSISADSYGQIGGFAGYTNGGTITFNNCVNNINITALQTAGGFVGSAYSTGTIKIVNCVNTGNITTLNSGYCYTAGFVAYASANITNLTIIRSQNNGTMNNTGNGTRICGLVGNSSATTTNFNYCVNTGDISGGNTLAGIIGDGTAAGKTVNITGCINTGYICTTRNSGDVHYGAIYGYYTNIAGTVNVTNSYYRAADIVFPAGVNDAQKGTAPKGTAKNTATDWTDGTIVDLLNTSKTYYKQGDTVPELYSFDGAGTEADPYQITCGADLDYMASAVNDGITDFSGKYLKQTANITYNENNSDYENWGTSAPAKTFTRIGNTSYYFRGTFDGNNYSIYGIYVNGGDATNGTGLFGATHNNTIKNLHIKKSYVKGNVCVGGIAGIAQGTSFTNCSFEGTVYSTAASACRAGGIIGDAAQGNTLNKCYTSGLVSAYAFSGGLIGRINGTYNGIVNSYSVADIDATGSQASTGSYHGGLVGLIQYKDGANSYMQRSFYYNESFPYSAENYIQHLVGYRDTTNGNTGNITFTNAFYPAQSADSIGYGENKDYADFKNNTVLSLINDDSAFIQGDECPVLAGIGAWDGVSKSTSFSGGTGTEADPYLISCAQDLAYFADQVNGGNDYSGKYILLTCDIDLNDKPFTPIGSGSIYDNAVTITNTSHCFRGVFDGGNYTVRNLYVNTGATVSAGFFGTAWGATIKNLNVEGSVKGTKGSYALPVAGFLGCANTVTITGCSFNGTVESTNTNANSVGGSGLVSTVTGGSLTINKCRVSGTVIGFGRSGGILGVLNGGFTANITNCYCDAIMTGTYTGYTDSSPTAGGLIGFLNTGTISVTDCFFYGTAPAKRSSGMAGPVINHKAGGTLTLTRVYYNSNNASLGDGASFNAAEDGVGKTAEAFADSTVLDLLSTKGTVFAQGVRHPEFIDVAFKGKSLMLADSIGVSFLLDLSGLSPAQKSSSYMIFTITEGGKTKSKTVAYDAEDVNSIGYYRFTCNISSVQMAEIITPVFHYDESEILRGKPYSVKQYIDYVTDDFSNGNSLGSSEQLISLLQAIGNYGYYAQQYFTSKTFKALTSSYAQTYNDGKYNSIKDDISSKALTAENGLANITNGSAKGQFQCNLNFDSTTSIMLRIHYNNSVNFTEVSKGGVNYSDRKNNYDSDRCTLYLLHLKVSQLSDVITVKGTVDGNSFTIPVSALSYVYAALNNGGTDLKNVVSALYEYHASAIYYANSVGLDRTLNADWV